MGHLNWGRDRKAIIIEVMIILWINEPASDLEEFKKQTTNVWRFS